MLLNGEEVNIEELPPPEDDDEPIDFQSMTVDEILRFLRDEDGLPQEAIDYIETHLRKSRDEAQVCLAECIARKAHEGQVDKAGMPYIQHPAYVASLVKDDRAKAVAWLHDVVEDTDVTFEDLSALGIEDDIIAALRLLTHDKSVPYMEYIEGIKSNELARTVKLADLSHNSDLSRLPEVTEKDLQRVEKYKEAMRILRTE